MEQLTRADIKTIVQEVIAPFIVEVKSLYTSNEKEIERLTKQSTEHYANFKAIEDKLQGQMMQCTNNMNNSAERSGTRTGAIEKDMAQIHTRIDTVEDQIKGMEKKKQFNITQLVAIVGIAVIIIFEVLPLIKG